MKTTNKLFATQVNKPTPPQPPKVMGLIKGSLPIDLGDGYKIGLSSLFTTSTARVATKDWAVDLVNKIAYHRNKLP